MSNYSFETSLQPFHEGQATTKELQRQKILALVAAGVNNLKELSDLTGIDQSTVSPRINELMIANKIKYEGFTWDYKDRKRKKIVVVKPVEIGTQQNLFV